VVDEPGGEEVADDGGTATDTDVLALGRVTVSRASAGEASRKWNVVPPSISIDGRGRWVRMKVGVWNGGFGPHHPFQSGSSCHPGGPNFPAPMISAPMPGRNRWAKASSAPPPPPPSLPCIV
jgi:hypothetical protein